jgi:gluconolactonase
MKLSRSRKITYGTLLILKVVCFCRCSSTTSPEWQKENQQLIKQHNLTERELSGLPESFVESNLESGKVKGLDTLATATLHPGITAKIFWGSGNMVSTLQPEPNAKIPEEVLTADRFVFVLEGSIDQFINNNGKHDWPKKGRTKWHPQWYSELILYLEKN